MRKGGGKRPVGRRRPLTRPLGGSRARERDHGLRDRGGRARRAGRKGGKGRRQRDIPRPNELQPTSGILLKMRGRGLPEGWPSAVEGRTLFRAARAPGPFRPACRPDHRLAVRTSHRRRSFLSSFRAPSKPREAGPACLPSPYPILAADPPSASAPAAPTRVQTHTYAVADWRTGARPGVSGRMRKLTWLLHFLGYLSLIVQNNNLRAAVSLPLSPSWNYIPEMHA